MQIFDALKYKNTNRKEMNSKEIIVRIKNYDVISFDVFDTLLKRNVSEPKKVFELIEKKLNKHYTGFAEKRSFAEKKARKKTKDEVTLYDIYQEYPDIEKADIEFLVNMELKTESEVLMKNIDIYPVLEYSLKENKTIILVSDMYLPQAFLEKILKREGIVGYKKLYLSSSIKKTKCSGKLFSVVINDLMIKKEEMIHIGDSMESDYRVPIKMGIKAIHIPTVVKKSSFSLHGNGIEKNVLNSFVNNSIPITVENEFYRFGYEKFGMFLWGYSKWLYQSLRKNNIDRVYFFSRDGYILKKAFDVLCKDNKIHSYYLEVSRRSLRVPVLWMNQELKDLLDMISPSKMIPLRVIFDGVGLKIEDYLDHIQKYNFDEKTVFDRQKLLQNKDLNQLYQDILPDIEKVSKKEYDLLVKYFDQNKIKNRFAIVDIGWSGGMQRYMDEILTKMQIPHQIKGYYIGVAAYYTRNINVVPNLDLNGYLFDFMHKENEKDKRSSFVGLFETLFLEQEGTVENYIDVGGKIKAKRLPYEYIENGNETKEYICVKQIQKGAMDFIRAITQNELLNKMNFTSDELFRGVRETGIQPTKKDLQMFSNFRFYDEGEFHKLAAPKRILYYCFHLKELKKDFLLSRWKTGFMKKLFKIKLPYEMIYNILIKLK